MSKIIITVTEGSEVTGIISDCDDVMAAVKVEGSDELTAVNVVHQPETITELEQHFSFTSEDL